MKKKVTYKGLDYTITFRPFAYSDSRFVINGEDSSFTMSNKSITHLGHFKYYAELAIKEYVARHNAKKLFNEWDGKL